MIGYFLTSNLKLMAELEAELIIDSIGVGLYSIVEIKRAAVGFDEKEMISTFICSHFILLFNGSRYELEFLIKESPCLFLP